MHLLESVTDPKPHTVRNENGTPRTHPCDIGLFYNSMEKLSHPPMYDTLKHIWTPGSEYKLPLHTSYGKARKFAFSWYQKFPWLAYSRMMDGALCIPCVFFSRRIGSKSCKLQRLMMCPLVDWSMATRRFNDHQCKSEIHKTSLLTIQAVISVMENEQPILMVNTMTMTICKIL